MSPGPGRYAVFEAVNETAKEFFVGTTALPPEEVASLPLSVGFRQRTRWKTDAKLSLRIVESGLPLEEALRFASEYARSVGRTGWKVIVE